MSPAKHQKLLNADQYVLVLSVLHAQRKSKTDYQQAMDEDYLTDALNSLHIAGFCMVPCGVIDSVKKSIDEIYYGRKPEQKAAKR